MDDATTQGEEIQEDSKRLSFLNLPPDPIDHSSRSASPTQSLPPSSIKPPASFSLDSTADTFSPSSTSTTSSFHQRATGYRHSFHRRHNSAKQRGHGSGNYPSYYNYRYDDSCSTDTLDNDEQPTLKLPTPVLTPVPVLPPGSKTPSPKLLPANSANSPTMYYDHSLQNTNDSSARNSFNLPVANNSSCGRRSDACDDDDFSATLAQQRQKMSISRNRSRSTNVSRESRCCYSHSAGRGDRRYSTSSTTSRDGCYCCCDVDDEDDVKCRGAGFCGSVCTKTFLITINLTFFVLGWTMMAGGVWVHIYRDSNHLGVLLRDNPTSPLLVSDRIAVFLIVSGAAVSMIGFLGCCGACTESVCFLGFYTVLLVVFIISQIILVVLISNFQETLEKNLARSMLYQVKNEYNVSDDAKLTISWDRIQSSMQCCGAIGPLDYHQSAWFNSTTDSAGVFVPTSCCKNLRPLSDPRNKEDLQGKSKYEADETAGGHDTEGKGGLHGSLSSGRMTGRSHLSTNTDIRYRDHRKWKRDEDGKRSLKPRSPASSSSLIPKDYLCQLEAMRLQFPNSQQEFVHVHTQGCHPAVIDLAKVHAPALTCVIFLDVLQVINLFYACVLIGIVRKKHSDYSWCEEEERI